MSTLAHAAPTARHESPGARIVSGRLVLVFGCSLGTLTSFYLMLSVTPLFASAAGAGRSAGVPLAAVPWLTGLADHRQAAAGPAAEPPIGLLAGLRRGEQLRPPLAFAATTVSAGVVVAFVPLATGASGNIAAVAL